MRGSLPKTTETEEEDATSVDRLPPRPHVDSVTEERTLTTRPKTPADPPHPASKEEPTVTMVPDPRTVTRTVDTAALRLDPTMPSPLGLEPEAARPPMPSEDELTLPPSVGRPLQRIDHEEDDGPRTVAAKVPVLLVDTIAEPSRFGRQHTKTARMLAPLGSPAPTQAPARDEEPIVIPGTEPKGGGRIALLLALAAVALAVGVFGVSRALHSRDRPAEVKQAPAEVTAPADVAQAPLGSAADGEREVPAPVDTAPSAIAPARTGHGRPPPPAPRPGKVGGIVRESPF